MNHRYAMLASTLVALGALTGCELEDAAGEPCPAGDLECVEPTPDSSVDGSRDCVEAPEVCNERDDDCDGQVDEGIEPVATQCGEAPCLAQGELICHKGDMVDTCRPPDPAECGAAEQRCEQADDFGEPCYLGPRGTEGVGACHGGTWGCDARGQRACVDQVVPRLEAKTRGRVRYDEDCDGQLDERDIARPACTADTAPCASNVESVSIAELPEGRLQKVIVRLQPLAAAPPTPEAERDEIAGLQDEVIDMVSGQVEQTGGVFQVTRRYRNLYALAVEADPIALDWLWRHADVASMMVDVPVKASMVEADRLIGGSEARRTGGVNGRGVRIGFIDSGIDYRHPAFGACPEVGAAGCRVVGGYDLFDDDDDPLDTSGHGTAVAGVAAGQAIGMEPAGLAPGAELVALRIADTDDLGEAGVGHLYAAVDWLIDNPDPLLRVVNFGYTTDYMWDEVCDIHFGRFADKLRMLSEERGILFVGPTGNDAVPLSVGFPSCLQNVLGTGAVYDRDYFGFDYDRCSDPIPADMIDIDADVVTCYSNGTAAPPGVISLLAPGTLIRTVGQVIDGEPHYQEASGTSIAAGMVAGAAALLFHARPMLSARDVFDQLLDTAVPVPQSAPEGFVHVGRLFVMAALDRDCLDEDGDGVGAFGEDCGPVVDCNDRDARTWPGAPEVCDSVDNDCDGQVDEGFDVGAACEEGVGACLAAGVRICADGVAVCSATPGVPMVETCNATDDDCDGAVDEDSPVGQACSVGVGFCEASGVYVCDGAGGEQCNAQAGQPRSEGDRRNGIDDNCDGVTDNCRPLRVETGSSQAGLGHCNAGFDGTDRSYDNCMDHINRDRCPTDREARAWCGRSGQHRDLWLELHNEWMEERDYCVRARTRDGRPAGEETWTRCIEFADHVCPDSEAKLETPLALRFGPFGDGPSYTWGPGAFDLSRHQDGSGYTRLWVTDGILIHIPPDPATLDATHLYGSATLDADGKPTFADGFEALAAMADTTGKPDGWVTHDELSPLGIWTDLNADQVVDLEKGEIRTLTELGVVAIHVEPYTREVEARHPSGRGFVSGRSEFVFIGPDGWEVGTVFDVYLR